MKAKDKEKSPRQDSSWGCLYVVATPIGNLEDITLRAIRILKEVALIAAEDTRHTKKLLNHFDIRTPLISYYKEKEAERSAQVIEHLKSGQDVALVSDAGTPGISDPGGILVQKARALGIRIVPVPGPSALAAALSVAGISGNSFLFLGFLPSRAAERKKLLASLAGEHHYLAFYEAPHRIVATLKDCLRALGDRKIFVARELTKLHEELISASISEVLTALADKDKVKGEFVVLIEGSEQEGQPQAENLVDLLCWFRDHAGLSLRDAVQKVSKDLDLRRSEVYEEALKIWKDNERPATKK